MKLRAAQTADIPVLAAIAADSYRTIFASILEPAALEQRNEGFFEAHLGSALNRLRVAVADKRVAGFSLVTNNHLDMLFIAADARGQGVGSFLLEAVEAEGVRTLECFRDNDEARAFYEQRGWRLLKEYERAFIGRRRAFVLYGKP
jgi:putative acetyltransferase